MEANASRYRGKAPDELDWTDAQRQKRAVAEYMAALEAEARSQDDIERNNGADDGSDGGREPRSERKPPKVISPSDPSSAWTARQHVTVKHVYQQVSVEAGGQAVVGNKVTTGGRGASKTTRGTNQK
jgi:hypothetical protein